MNQLTEEECKVLTLLIDTELRSWKSRIFHDVGHEASMKKYADFYIATLESIRSKINERTGD